MKFRILILSVLVLGILSCAEDRPAPQVLKTSEQNINFSGKPGAWSLTVNSNTTWTVENETDWCRVDKTQGTNTEQLVISVDSNLTNESRSTILHLISQYHTGVSFPQTQWAVYSQPQGVLLLAYPQSAAPLPHQTG